VVHMPKDVITVLGKRVGAEGAEKLEMVTLDYFKSLGKPAESPEAHASSSSAPPGQAPGPNPASSTANPGLLKEPSSPPSTAPSESYEGDDQFHDVPLDGPPSSEYGSDHGLTGAHAPLPKLPNPKPRPSTDSKSDMSLLYPPVGPASQKEFGQAHGYQAERVQQPNPGPSADSDFDWNYWTNHEDPPPPKPASSKSSSSKLWTKLGSNLKSLTRPASQKELGEVHGSQVENAQQPNTEPSSSMLWKKLGSNLKSLVRPASQKESGQVEHVQQPSPGPSADFDWNYWLNHEDPPPKPPPTNSGSNWKKLIDLMDPLTPEAKLALSKPSNSKPSTDSESAGNWKSWINPLNLLDPLTPEARLRLTQSKPLNPKPSDAGPSNPELWTPRPSDPGPSNPELWTPSPNLGSPKKPENEVLPGPLPNPDPEHNSGHQSSSADSQPVDPEAAAAAARYALKGKAKVERRVSGTARDVGNAAQREL